MYTLATMISSNEIREKYLNFFEKRGHKRIAPAPLVLEGDSTTLFTSSGMQPLVPYLLGEKHPEGVRLVDSQPCLRTVDIDEVGDNRHLTFFEMLGNWSLGDYFKKEQLFWIWEFYTKVLGLPKEKLAVSISAGGKGIPEDKESFDIWKKIGIKEDRIFKYPIREENWWSRSGKPSQMPPGEIGGPDSEIFFEFSGVKHNPKFGRQCHPNCECGRFLEIGNSVFMQYKKREDGKFDDLPNKNIDFGGGLERITAAVNNDPDIFKTDIYLSVIKKLERLSGKKYGDNIKNFRIVADHLRASEALVEAGVLPLNKQQGYVLRRLIRRMALKFKNIKKITNNEVILDELNKFEKTLSAGLKKVKRIDKIDAKTAFYLYESYGFPFELIEDIAKDRGQKISKKEFEEELEKHKNLSRTASSGMFKGGLVDTSEETTKLHTATHLLHAALRKILGESVSQKGSNITAERLRFDFSYSQKLTEEQIKQVEDLVNKQVDKDLEVSFEMMSYQEAVDSGALHFFDERYGERVKVYKIGDFSKEICGGPHVKHTSTIGHVRIFKQQKIGAGIIRIYANISKG